MQERPSFIVNCADAVQEHVQEQISARMKTLHEIMPITHSASVHSPASTIQDIKY